MGESFVDVSYRGLEVGKRLKLRDVRSESGYLEIPLPMPVGTKLEIAVDDGLRIEAVVTSVHEQVGGSDAHPGMRLAPALSGKAAEWWQGRVDAAAEAAEKAAVERAAAEKAAVERAAAERAAADKAAAEKLAAEKAAPVTDTPAAAMARSTTVMSTDQVQAALAAAEERELAEDGRSTDVMDVVDPSVAEEPGGGGRTTVMDAVDISMITGEANSEVGLATDDDDEAEISIESSGEVSRDIDISPSGKVSNGNGKSKRGSRSRSKKGKR